MECLYIRDGLPIKRRTDLELLPEIIITEIKIARKSVLFGTIYLNPSQNSEQFETFIDSLQQKINRMKAERPDCTILTGDLNCRSSMWWSEDDEQPEGTALDELMKTNGLYQLIEEQTNIRNEGCSCIDLIITDQPNMLVDYSVCPSLDEHCQHQIIHGKFNVSLPSPPQYKRIVWDYGKADVQMIIDSINKIDCTACFDGLTPTEIVEIFTNALSEIFSEHISNKVVKFDDRDSPWMKRELKTAIKRKRRIYAKFVRRGRKQEDWDCAKRVQNLASKMLIKAKNNYYLDLGRKLSNNVTGAKSYWSLFNRLLNKKAVSNIPPFIENGFFITNVEAKANVFNDFLLLNAGR